MNADGLMCTRIGLTLFIKNLLKRVKKKKIKLHQKNTQSNNSTQVTAKLDNKLITE